MEKLLLVAVIGVWAMVPEAAGVIREQSISASSVSRALATAEPLAGEGGVVVRVANLSKVPLEAWRLVLLAEGVDGLRPIHDVTTDASLSLIGPGTDRSGSRGPIGPGEIRERTYPIQGNPQNVSVELRMVLFEDLSSEGSPDDVAYVLRQRERHAEALGVWSNALEAASRMPPQQAKGYLRSVLSAEEARSDPSNTWAKGLRLTIAELIASPESTQAFSEQLAAFEQVVTRQHQRALRHKSGR